MSLDASPVVVDATSTCDTGTYKYPLSFLPLPLHYPLTQIWVSRIDNGPIHGLFLFSFKSPFVTSHGCFPALCPFTQNFVRSTALQKRRSLCQMIEKRRRTERCVSKNCTMESTWSSLRLEISIKTMPSSSRCGWLRRLDKKFILHKNSCSQSHQCCSKRYWNAAWGSEWPCRVTETCDGL